MSEPLPPLRYEAELEADDYVSARRLDLRPRRAVRTALTWLGALLVVVVGWDFYLGLSGGHVHPFAPILLAGGLFVAAYLYFILPRQTRRAFAVEKALHISVAGELADAELILTLGGRRTVVTWERVLGWQHDRRILLLTLDDGSFGMVPLRGFTNADERTAALRLLTAKLGPAS